MRSLWLLKWNLVKAFACRISVKSRHLLQAFPLRGRWQPWRLRLWRDEVELYWSSFSWGGRSACWQNISQKKSFIKITKVHLPQASQVSREVAFSQENDGRSKRYFESSTCKMPMILSTRALLQSLTRQPNLALASLLRLCRLPSSEGALGLCKIPTSNLQMRFVCSLSSLYTREPFFLYKLLIEAFQERFVGSLIE